jgi:hypothetical protein
MTESRPETPEQGMRQIPPAMEGRMVIVRSENPEVGEVIVARWSIEKAKMILDDLLAVWKALSADIREDLIQAVEESDAREDGKSKIDTASLAMEVIASATDRVLNLVRLSVVPEDRAKVGQMDADELFDLVDAIVKVNPNFVPKLKKKAWPILARFGFAKGEEKTPAAKSQ